MNADDRKVRYTLTVYVDRPIDADENAEDYVSSGAKIALEKEFMHVLRRLDGDCDCEVMDAEILAEGGR